MHSYQLLASMMAPQKSAVLCHGKNFQLTNRDKELFWLQFSNFFFFLGKIVRTSLVPFLFVLKNMENTKSLFCSYFLKLFFVFKNKKKKEKFWFMVFFFV